MTKHKKIRMHLNSKLWGQLRPFLSYEAWQECEIALEYRMYYPVTGLAHNILSKMREYE